MAGKITAGGICAHFISDATFTLTFDEMVEMLEAQPARTCVPVPGLNVCAADQSTGTPIQLPARGAAIIMSSDDFGNLKTEAEEMCRELGKRCSYAAQKVLSKLRAADTLNR